MSSELVTAGKFIDPETAHVVKSFLESNGIAAEVFGDAMTSIYPGMGIAQGVSVLVARDKEAEARALIKEFESATPPMTDYDTGGDGTYVEEEEPNPEVDAFLMWRKTANAWTLTGLFFPIGLTQLAALYFLYQALTSPSRQGRKTGVLVTLVLLNLFILSLVVLFAVSVSGIATGN